jgi:hypothetical protein
MTYKTCNIYSFIAYFTCQKGGEIYREKSRLKFPLSLKRKKISKRLPENIRHRIVISCVPRLSSSQPKAYLTSRSDNGSICLVRSSQKGENASLSNAWPGFRNGHGAGARALFPPDIIVEIKALACQLPKNLVLPFSPAMKSHGTPLNGALLPPSVERRYGVGSAPMRSARGVTGVGFSPAIQTSKQKPAGSLTSITAHGKANPLLPATT